MRTSWRIIPVNLRKNESEFTMKLRLQRASELLATMPSELRNYQSPQPGLEDLVWDEESEDWEYPPGDLLLDKLQRAFAANDSGKSDGEVHSD